MKKSTLLIALFQLGVLQAAGAAKIINKTGDSLKINTATLEKGYIKNKKEVQNLSNNASFTVSKLPITYLLEPKGYSTSLFVTIDKSVSYVLEFKTAGSDDPVRQPGVRYLTVTQQ